jgi:hypothetical protein
MQCQVNLCRIHISDPHAFLTVQAELINGRAAMIGFAALLAIELAKGSALF